ncbi:MAG: restriction endonuclease subunit S [Prevotella sp.]|nr:restriction endonuclease subunit S [Prevotella sp.]
MEGWNEVRVGDLFDIKAGGDLQESCYSPIKTKQASYPIYANSLEDKGLYGYTSKPRFSGNAITITGRGDIGHAEFRANDFDAIVRLLVLLPKVDVDCRYITYYINSHVHFPKESTGVPQLTAPKVKRIKIKLPQSKAEQTAIAKILSKVDDAIASVHNNIAAAERLKKSLIQNLLTGKKKPDATFRTPEEFNIDEKFGKVPIGWEVKRVDEVFDFYPTASYSRSMLKEDGECKYIHYGDIHTKFDTFLDISEESLPYITQDMIKKFVLLKEGDLIISDTSEDYDGVGKLVELVNVGDIKVISGLHTLLLRPKTDELINGFKGYLFNEERVRLELLKYVTGIKVYSISKNSLSKVLLPIPTRMEQEQIKERLDSVNNKILVSKNIIKNLDRLKMSLMQNLLTGKVEINKQ